VEQARQYFFKALALKLCFSISVGGGGVSKIWNKLWL